MATWADTTLCTKEDVLKAWNDAIEYVEKDGFEDTSFTSKLASLKAYVETLTDHVGYDTIATKLGTLADYAYASEVDSYYTTTLAEVQTFLQGVLDVIEGGQQFNLIPINHTGAFSCVTSYYGPFDEPRAMKAVVYRHKTKLTYDANGSDPSTFRVLSHHSDNVDYTFAMNGNDLEFTPTGIPFNSTSAPSDANSRIYFSIQINGTNIVKMATMQIYTINQAVDQGTILTPSQDYISYDDLGALETETLRMTLNTQGDPISTVFENPAIEWNRTTNVEVTTISEFTVIDNSPDSEVIDVLLSELDDWDSSYDWVRIMYERNSGDYVKVRSELPVLRGTPVTSDLDDVLSNYSDFEYLYDYLNDAYNVANRESWLTSKHIVDAKAQVLKDLQAQPYKSGFEDYITNPTCLKDLCVYKTISLINEYRSNSFEDQFYHRYKRYETKYKEEMKYVRKVLISDQDNDGKRDDEEATGEFNFQW